MPNADGAFALKDVVSAVKQGDGSWIITHSSGTHTIPADISDNSGGTDAYVAANGSSFSPSAVYAWLKKFWGK